MKPLTHGSLFAGIGGFDLGFERAGIKTVWQVEIDQFCRKVLEKHFSEAGRLNDVRLCFAWDGEGFRIINPLPRVDVITGGFPCQDISAANTEGLGLDGTRSGLWFEYLRIISELRPRYVLVENVPALFFRGIERVIGGLAEIGYDAEWTTISAASIGAPHVRERVWILAYPQSNLRRASRHEGYETFNWCDSLLADAYSESARRLPQRESTPYSESGVRSEDVADSAGIGRARSRVLIERSGTEANGEGQANHALAMCFRDQWAVEPNVGRVANGVPARVDRLKSLGNAIVPQIAEWIGRRIIEAANREEGVQGD